MSENVVSIEIKAPTGKSTRGTASLHPSTRQMAISKGVRWWLSGWVLAILCIAIPIIHFVAVPLFLLASPLVGFVIYKIHNGGTEIYSEAGICPDCDKPLEFKTWVGQWPLTVSCKNCREPLKISQS